MRKIARDNGDPLAERQKEKRDKRAEQKERTAEAGEAAEEVEDPDIAGIKLGPQPPPDEAPAD
jgi:hypothetical protein